MKLTTAEKRMQKLLLSVDRKTIWGHAIHNVLENRPEFIKDLVQQLRSQQKDNPEIMKEILGGKTI